LVGFTPEAVDAKSIASSVGKSYDPSFDWDGLSRIRDRWPRKLLVKGILHPEDARRAAQLGCDAVIVSNHGGRQLDTAIGSLDALPAVIAAVGDRMDVLVDGGVRRGTDILKALALGAKAVMIGRPLLYGVCAGGEAGASRVLHILHDEMVRCMKLSGRAAVAAIDKTLLRTQP
jgi:(S)-mandelate dehydrogenase